MMQNYNLMEQSYGILSYFGKWMHKITLKLNEPKIIVH